MNGDMVIGQLKELLGRFLEELGLFMGDERLAIDGKRYQIVGDLQFRAGMRHLGTGEQVTEWMERARA
jgi:uncharacterized protein YjbJ (UPF0337 family)